ncbi:CUB and sushi domain-containing protein 3 [Lamellibrachia satsuma]|nr:CUB and sushi domain-containing protein 3 [Lamellibrachia satsuma]
MGGSLGVFGINETEYGNNMRCVWKIQVNATMMVKLEFLSFDTQQSYDRVTVHDREDTSTTQLGTFSGQHLPGDIFSDSDILVSFQSNSYYTRTGFRVKYTALENGCGSDINPVTMGGSLGVFGINETEYGNNMKCVWNIQVNDSMIEVNFNTTLKLEFLSFDTDYYDRVTIHDREDTSTTQLGTFSGQRLPGDIFSNSDILISFQSNSYHTRTGFRVKYTASENSCGSDANPVVMGGSVGSFGINETEYGNNMRCVWKIRVNFNMIIKLEFLSLDTQDYYDYVTIQDGSTLLGTFSGQRLPGDIFSDSAILIAFQSNSYYTRTGFRVKYTALENGCGSDANPVTMGGSVGVFGINRAEYRNNMRCVWKIEVNVTMAIHLEFLNFHTESGCDKVSVYDGDTNVKSLLETFSGSSLPRAIYSDDSLFIVFRTDGSVISSGFRIKYTVLENTAGKYE